MCITHDISNRLRKIFPDMKIRVTTTTPGNINVSVLEGGRDFSNLHSFGDRYGVIHINPYLSYSKSPDLHYMTENPFYVAKTEHGDFFDDVVHVVMDMLGWDSDFHNENSSYFKSARYIDLTIGSIVVDRNTGEKYGIPYIKTEVNETSGVTVERHKDGLDRGKLYRSRDRAYDKSEVFTPPHIAKLMGDMVLYGDRISSTMTLDPTCGNGNLLTYALSKKIEHCASRKRNGFADRRDLLMSLIDIFGVDIMHDNVVETRIRLYKMIRAAFYERKQNVSNLRGADKDDWFEESCATFIRRNIAMGDALLINDVVFPYVEATKEGMCKTGLFRFNNDRTTIDGNEVQLTGVAKEIERLYMVLQEDGPSDYMSVGDLLGV